MCDASDFTVGAILGQKIDEKFKLAGVVTIVGVYGPLRMHFPERQTKAHKVGSDSSKNPDLGTFTEEEIADEFPDEHLVVLKTELNNDEPCESVTGRKVYESRFFWPTIFKDAKDYVIRCDACQKSRNISSRSEMPQNNIQVQFKMEPDIDNMTLNKYLMYQGMHRDLERSCTSRNRIAYSKVAPVKYRNFVYPDSNEEDDEYYRQPPLPLCFQTPQPCTKFNSISYNFEVDVDENIDISIAREIEEVQVEDIGMDGNHNVDPLNT
ncbi:reverse transcriptase domain-containing protein [Tanacetum coccineum]|uniref:Reverse transcriptase domain-containing protein n=1 Tax=Tanacetum coccineum TaxID=301880 RepID=A0ABQ4Y593_9ASTR